MAWGERRDKNERSLFPKPHSIVKNLLTTPHTLFPNPHATMSAAVDTPKIALITGVTGQDGCVD